jgi:RNA polymerase sigma factor (sigma-70 family)
VVLPPSDVPDAELVRRVRAGDHAAYGELWQRHAEAGRSAARRVTQRFEPDDLVQEAFARILETLDAGNGPEGAFRPYLYTTIRNVAATWSARASTVPLDDAEVVEPADHTDHGALLAEGSLLGRAYASLPPEWAEVLWYTELEELSPAEVAPLLGLQANSVAALSYRAREGLRRAWLQAHVTRLPDRPDCRWVAERVGDYHRDALSHRARGRFDEHVAGCADCPVLVAEVADEAAILVRSRLRALLWPAVLGVAAGVPLPGVVGSTAAGTAPARRFGRRPSPRELAAGVAAAAVLVTAVTVGALAIGSGDRGAPAAAEPAPAAPALADPAPEPASDEGASGTGAAAEPDPEAAGTDVDEPAGEPGAGADRGTSARDRTRPVVVPTVDLDPAPPAAVEPDQPDPVPAVPVVPVLPPVTEPVDPTDPVDPVDPVEPVLPAAPVVTDVLADPHYLPALSGTATPGAEVEVRTAAGALAGRATAADDGTWRVATDTPLAAGAALTLTATQTLDGLTSPAAGPFGPFVMVAPTVVSPSDGGTVVLDGTGATGDVEVRFSGTEGLLAEAAVDGVATGRTHVLETEPLVRVVRAVAPGSHTFAVRYADPDRGLVGVWTTVAFEVVAP